MALRRRELLTWVGLTAGGFIGVGCAGKGAGKRSPLSTEAGGDALQDLAGQAEFNFLASSSGGVEVVTREGEGLGSFGVSALEEALRQQAGEPTVEKGAARQELDLRDVLSRLPAPLMLVSQHPMRNFRSLEAGYTLDLLVVPRPEMGQDPRMGRAIQKVALTWDAKFKLREYFIRISIEKHYLGACIKRNAWHVGVLVHHLPTSTLSPRSNNLAFDLHVASWWEQKRPCFAVYESKTRFCRNVCQHPSWGELVVVLYSVLAAGLVARAPPRR